MRLFNYKVSDVDDFKIEENEEAEELENESQQNSLFIIQDKNDNQDETNMDIQNTFKNRKALNNLINFQRIPNAIRNLKWVTNCLLIILLAIAFADYFVTIKEFEV